MPVAVDDGSSLTPTKTWWFNDDDDEDDPIGSSIDDDDEDDDDDDDVVVGADGVAKYAADAGYADDDDVWLIFE